MGAVLLLIFLISVFFYYAIKGAKLLVGITPAEERRREKNKFKEARKKYLKNILNDKKFINQTYNEYIKKHRKKYPESKHPKNKVPNANSYLSKSGWINEINKTKERIRSHEFSIFNRKFV